MTDSLPEWYAPTATPPPYDDMIVALPWLDEERQFNAWIDGVREASENRMDAVLLHDLSGHL